MMKRSMFLLVCTFLWSATCQAQVYNLANGHYYLGVVRWSYFSWYYANSDANARTYDGMAGHLATITSAEENNFLVSNINYFPAASSYWVGGFQQPSNQGANVGWRWVTGEPWSYTNWAAGEPNDSAGTNEDGLEWRYHTNQYGTWNDYMRTAGVPGYIIEFEPVPEPSSLLALLCGVGGLGRVIRQGKR